MQNAPLSTEPGFYAGGDFVSKESAGSGVAWAAIIGGALAMTATTLILLPLGSALGFAISSPWHHDTSAIKTFSIASGIWMIVVQWLAAALGGYLTGRLRAKWVGAHTHEVFFRDTVHGFLAWGLSAVTGAVLLVSVVTQLAAGSPMHHEMMGREAMGGPQSMYTDRLFRSNRGPTSISEQDRIEAGHLLMKAEDTGNMADADRVYLVHMVSDRTGLPEAEAEKRVDDIIVQDKIEADKARKAAASASFLLALSMLIGAFVASAAGALGGRDRDIHYHTGKFWE